MATTTSPMLSEVQIKYNGFYNFNNDSIAANTASNQMMTLWPSDSHDDIE